MKQIKYLVALALAAAFTVPAMAEPKVTFSGGAKVRYGFQYMEVDKNSMESMSFLAGLREDNNNALLYGAFATSDATAVALKGLFDTTAIPAANVEATLAGGGTTLAQLNAALGTNFTSASFTKAVNDYRSRKYANHLFTGQKQEQAARLNMKVEDDKLTVKIGAEVDSNKQFELKQAALSFDYGFGSITYDAAGTQNR